MAFKINIAGKGGKTWKIETDALGLVGKKLNETIQGNMISPDLVGYEFEISGASDRAGFTAMANVEGVALKRILLSYEKGMNKRPKREGKKKRSDSTPKGLRLRKTVRGNTISEHIVQINLKTLKEGGKKFEEIFIDQMPKKEEEIKETPQENSE